MAPSNKGDVNPWESDRDPRSLPKAAPDGILGIGSFLGAVVDFVIIAFFVFIITRMLLKEQPAPPGPAMKTCADLR